MTSKHKEEVTRTAGFTQPLLPILYISQAILRDTFAYFLPYGRAGVETACYWFGIEVDTSQVVTTIVIPRLYQTKGNYRIRDTRVPAKVTLMLDKEIAHYLTAQHLAWMLVNLLARQTYEIHEIELIVPEGVPVVGRLSPLISVKNDLRVALQEGISHINSEVLIPKTTEKSRISVRIGPGPLGEADFALATTSYGWSGYVGRASANVIGEDNHPIGAYVAASLCAGEIFKFVRGMDPKAMA